LTQDALLPPPHPITNAHLRISLDLLGCPGSLDSKNSNRHPTLLNAQIRYHIVAHENPIPRHPSSLVTFRDAPDIKLKEYTLRTFRATLQPNPTMAVNARQLQKKNDNNLGEYGRCDSGKENLEL